MEDYNNMIRCCSKFARKEILGYISKMCTLNWIVAYYRFVMFDLKLYRISSNRFLQISAKSKLKKKSDEKKNKTFTIVVVQDIFWTVIHHNKQCGHVMSTAYSD